MSSILGSLHKVDCESLNSVVQQYDQALEENFTKRGQLEKFRDDYIKLAARLQTLPDKLEVAAMVPLCSKAICPGKLIHTNEILVLLGENTFLECTAKQAGEIIKHRLKNIDATLNRLDKERELYNSWKLEAERQMVETLGDGTIEIVEDYDEQVEAQWRKDHREKVRKHHQDLAKARASSATSSCVNNVGQTPEEEKLWTRLDALELEEEFMEAQAIYEERISTNDASSTNDKCTVKIRERSKTVKLNLLEFQPDNRDAESTTPSNNSGKKVTFSPDNIIHNLAENLSLREYKKKVKDLSNTSSTPSDPEGKGQAVGEEIELYKPSDSSDNGLYDPIFIRFRHDPLPSSSPDNGEQTGSESDSEEDDDDADYQIVLSPGDIFEQFGPPSLLPKSVPGADKTPLKSILKPRGGGGHSDGSGAESISHKDLCTTANVAKKGVAAESSITIVSEEVKERVPKPDVNDIYAMFPGLAPSSKESNFNPNDITAATAGGSDNNDKPSELLTSPGSGASIDLSVNCSSTTRPISLFKRMKSQERALSSDTSTNN